VAVIGNQEIISYRWFTVDIHGQIVAWRRRRAFARDQTPPGFMALMDDLHCILLVFGFSREGKGIFLLAIRDLVDPKKKKGINKIECSPVSLEKD